VVPKNEWRPETADAGDAAPGIDTPNIQWGAVGRKP
jgi:hypothetical protein